jgi:hypothetical protein
MGNGSSVSKDSTKEQFIVKLPLSSQVPRDFGVPKDWALSNDHLDLDRGLRTGIVHQKARESEVHRSHAGSPYIPAGSRVTTWNCVMVPDYFAQEIDCQGCRFVTNKWYMQQMLSGASK